MVQVRVSCEMQRLSHPDACTWAASSPPVGWFSMSQTTRASLETAPTDWMWPRLRCRAHSPLLLRSTNQIVEIMINILQNLKRARNRSFRFVLTGTRNRASRCPASPATPWDTHKDLTWTWDCSSPMCMTTLPVRRRENASSGVRMNNASIEQGSTCSSDEPRQS